MKQYILILLLLACTHHALAQAPPIQWEKSLGGTNVEEAQALQQTADGGYIVAGFSLSNNEDVSGHHGDSAYADYWVVKINDTGAIQWQKSLGGTNDEIAYAVQQTTDGGYIIAGCSKSNDGDVSGNHGNYDYWVVKLNDTGGIQWQKSLGGSNTDQAQAIQQTTDGGYIVAGSSSSNNGDVSGHHGDSSHADMWIVKLNDTGAIQWQKSLGGDYQDEAWAIQQTTDGGYIVAGLSASNNGDVTGHHGDTTYADYWVVKLNDTGTMQWQKSLGGDYQDEAYAIKQTIDGGYIVAGFSASNNGDVSGNHGDWDYWVVKLNDTGIIQWQKSLGGSNRENAFAIQQTTEGGYIVAGGSLSNDGEVSGNHGNYDLWVVKLNDTGTLQWQSSLGSGNLDYALAIQQATDGGYVVAGEAGANDGNVTGYHGGEDFWVVKLKSTLSVNMVNNMPAITLIPNPTTGTVSVKGAGMVSIKASNAAGMLVTEAANTDHISLFGLPPGLYLISVFNSQGALLKQDKIIKE